MGEGSTPLASFAMAVDPSLASESYCYLTTTGRVSGEPREIEIWFGLDGDTLYMLSGGGERSNWVRNLLREPEVSVRLGDQRLRGRARIVAGGDEDARARRLLLEKYSAGYSGDLSDWGRTALPVAVDLG
jgi:deazaflavin-dependent oxidoreductase (nitroreductase family)